jgi:hypothetical protein
VTLVLPVLLAAAVLVCVVVLAVRELLTPPPPARLVDDPELAEWAHGIQARLPDAFDALQLARTGTAGRVFGKREKPIIHGGARLLPAGASWRVEFPGAVISEDVQPSRLAGALNKDRIVAEVAEADEVAPGWADVRVFRADPLIETHAPPWEAGTIPPCVGPGEICWGIRRNGEHYHLRLVVPGVGAQCMLIGGTRGSGKSEAILSLLAQIAAWGTVDITLVDLARQGLDLGRFAPLAEAEQVIQAIEPLRAALDLADTRARRRASRMRELGMRVLDEPTPDRKLRAMVIDEIQQPMGDFKARLAITRAAQEHRAMGGFIIAATQYPTIAALGGDQLGPQFRAQMGYRACFKVTSGTEGAVILGKSLEGDGPHHLKTGPGSAVVDADDSGQTVIRTWRMTDEWLAEHIGRLLEVRAAQPVG